MNKLKKKPKLRKHCRKCRTLLQNKPEVGAVCPRCGWCRGMYTVYEVKKMTNELKDSWLTDGNCKE